MLHKKIIMNSFTADSAISNSAEQYNIQSNSNFRDAEFYSEKYHLATLADLYSKQEDEPDFDCEFLYSL
ncbi:hypothetical protein LL966_05525 [Flavobacterium chungbukense]|uniref:Uncharacterized protein n=2 Tax=Flavobacterium chungbukense TaxID=877464 RepID=A0ABP7XMN2_9FLAO|nr:hypothetical protein [Flavobacterium chungbukense]